MEHLQSILKDFDGVATPIDELLIWYFRDGLRFFICTQLDEKDRNLDDWQVVVKQAVNAKTKVARQALLLVQESNVCCPHGYSPLKSEKFKDLKDSEAKKNHLTANNNSGSGNEGQSDQASNESSKKDSWSNRWGQQSQSFNIPITGNNATIVKKDKNQSNRYLS